MERQRNNTQLKGKEESSERELHEIQTSKLSDTEFKIMVIKKFNDFSENYKILLGSYKELTVNYNTMKKDIETSIRARRK